MADVLTVAAAVVVLVLVFFGIRFLVEMAEHLEKISDWIDRHG